MLQVTECKAFISRWVMRLRSRWQCWVAACPRRHQSQGPALHSLGVDISHLHWYLRRIWHWGNSWDL